MKTIALRAATKKRHSFDGNLSIRMHIMKVRFLFTKQRPVCLALPMAEADGKDLPSVVSMHSYSA